MTDTSEASTDIQTRPAVREKKKKKTRLFPGVSAPSVGTMGDRRRTTPRNQKHTARPCVDTRAHLQAACELNRAPQLGQEPLVQFSRAVSHFRHDHLDDSCRRAVFGLVGESFTGSVFRQRTRVRGASTPRLVVEDNPPGPDASREKHS